MTKALKIFVCWLFWALSFHPAGAQTSYTEPRSGVSPAVQPATQTVDPRLVPVADVFFYSHSFGENFPHAFVIVAQADAQGRHVYDAFGFSAKYLSPKILFGKVEGHIAVPGDRYIRQSVPHFRVTINAQQKAYIDSIRHRWSENRYHLNKHNCVHFIAELAQAVGLRTNPDSDHFKEPKTYLEEVLALNPYLQGSLQPVAIHE